MNTTPSIPKGKFNPHVAVDDPRHMAPSDGDYTHGTYRHRETGAEFVLAVHEPDDYFRTHSLKNSGQFWQGSEEQFLATFEEVKLD